MRKMFLFAALLLAASFCMFGCQKSKDGVVEINVDGSVPTGGSMPDMSGFQGSMPSGEMPSGQRPQSGSATGGSTGSGGKNNTAAVGESEVIGKVQRIAGNYVTLLMGESANGSITYGEEEKSYLLPVGMSIGASDFSSVTAGMALKLTFESGSDNITAVTIVSR